MSKKGISFTIRILFASEEHPKAKNSFINPKFNMRIILTGLLLANIFFSSLVLEPLKINPDLRLFSALIICPVIVFLIKKKSSNPTALNSVLETSAKANKIRLFLFALIIGLNLLNILITFYLKPVYQKTFNDNRFYFYCEYQGDILEQNFFYTITVRDFFLFEKQFITYDSGERGLNDEEKLYMIKMNFGTNHPALEEAVGSWYIPGSEKVKLYISSDSTFKLYDNSNGKKEFLSGKVIFDKNVLKLDYSDSVMQKFKFFKFFKEEDNLYIDDEIYRFEKQK